MLWTKYCLAVWFVSTLAPSSRAIKLQTPKIAHVEGADEEVQDAEGMQKLTCAVPSVMDKFNKTCSLEEKLVSNEHLEPLQIAPAKFAKTGERITKNAYRMGLPKEVRQTLVDYCDKVGITKRFRELVNDPLPPGDDGAAENFGGFDWTIQRPGSHWNNNMHWLTPADNDVFDEYLKVLGDAGFDRVLEKLGKYFGFEDIGVYLLSFHAVSYAPNGGYMHVDFSETDSKAFNVLVPLILANETAPELGVMKPETETTEKQVGLYRYEDDVAMLIGDGAYHVTARCDYTGTDYMRMIAIIYVAEVTPDNVGGVMGSYFGTQFPTEGDVQWLYDQGGRHWGKDGQSLPTHADDAATLEKKKSIKRKTREVPKNKPSVKDNAVYADRFIHGLLDTINDYDCMEREFDVMDESYNATEAIGVLKKCKVLVLRNVFDKKFLTEYRANFTNYIEGIHSGRISSTGKTTNGENYYLHNIDHKRWEVILPESFAHENLLADEDVMNVLTDDRILGPDLVLHSLGTALAEPGADAQRWHADNNYLFSDSLFRTSGIGGHDLPAYAVTMMVPLLNMTGDHGPTQFCMGSSWLQGLDMDPKEIKLKDKSLRSVVNEYRQGTFKGFCPYVRTPQLGFGDMLLFDYQITHRGGKNQSPDLRSIMYMTYSREWYKDTNFRPKDRDEREPSEEEYEGACGAEEAEEEEVVFPFGEEADDGCGAPEEEVEWDDGCMMEEEEDEDYCSGGYEDDDEYERESRVNPLYEQLTRTARFALPDNMTAAAGEMETPSEGLEAIRRFLPGGK